MLKRHPGGEFSSEVSELGWKIVDLRLGRGYLTGVTGKRRYMLSVWLFRLNGALQGSVLLLISAFCFVSLSANAAKGGAIVGLLSTKSSTYVGEYRTAVDIRNVLLKSGAKKVVIIDYNAIVKSLGNEVNAARIYKHLNEFLLKNKIDRIFIPGNYYNISSAPLPPGPQRQMVTDAIVSVMKDRPNLKLLAICGGLQGILHAQGVSIKKVQSILNSSEMAESHLSSVSHPREPGASLLKVEAVPGSILAKIVAKVRASEGATLQFYVPDMHKEGVDPSAANMEKLRSLGYRVSAMADDGVIEGLEDSRGNMLLQMHPEFLLVNANKKTGKNHEVDLSIKVANEIMNHFLSDSNES